MRPGHGLSSLLRGDTLRHYRAPTLASIAGIELRPTHHAETLRALGDTVAVMRAHGDPRAVFPEVYGLITRNVGREVEKGRGGIFKEPEWVSRLTGSFAERYFVALVAALQGRKPESHAWRVSFDDGLSGHTVPILDALLGINAHINYDLAQSLVDIIGSERHPDKMERFKHDYDVVNVILRVSMPEIFDRLEDSYGCSVTRQISRMGARLYAMDFMLGTLQRWREDVWGDLLKLLAGDVGHVERMNRKSEKIALTMSVRGERSMFRRFRRVGQAVAPLHPILSLVRKNAAGETRTRMGRPATTSK